MDELSSVGSAISSDLLLFVVNEGRNCTIFLFLLEYVTIAAQEQIFERRTSESGNCYARSRSFSLNCSSSSSTLANGVMRWERD